MSKKEAAEKVLKSKNIFEAIGKITRSYCKISKNT